MLWDDENRRTEDVEEAKSRAKTYFPSLHMYKPKSGEWKALKMFRDKLLDTPYCVCGCCQYYHQRSAVTSRDVCKHQSLCMKEVFPDAAFEKDAVEEEFLCAYYWKYLREDVLPASS